MNQQSMLLLAAAAGLVTGIVALADHFVATGLHAIGGLAALALVIVLAYRIHRRSVLLLMLAMVVANVTGVAWTVLDARTAVTIAHVMTGVFASAGALLFAIE